MSRRARPSSLTLNPTAVPLLWASTTSSQDCCTCLLRWWLGPYGPSRRVWRSRRLLRCHWRPWWFLRSCAPLPAVPDDARPPRLQLSPARFVAVGRHPSHVFTYEGNPIVQVNTKAWRNALQRAGIQYFRWHDLRHTFATWHREAGTPTHELQRLGGRKTQSMVERYAHVAPEGLQLAASRLDAYLGTQC